MKELKNMKGITLIALVVTIIVLIILAGVSINMLFGQYGIVTRAKQAKEQMEVASIKEQIGLDILSKQAENSGNITNSDLINILNYYGKLSKEEQGLILTTTKGNYEIKVSDILNEINVKVPATLPEILGGANSPDIKGFNVEKTHYVTWGTTSPYQINELNETNTIDKEPPTGWSNYTGKQWANIITKGGDNECYWVWIPRYAYKVPTKGNIAQTIEIAFLKGTGSTIDDVIDETKKIEIETAGGFKTTPTPGNWVIHPAFTNAGNGGFGELTGIWVAKFEASSSSATDLTNLTTDKILTAIANDGGSETDTDLKVRVKPNVTSWRGINVNNIFTVCQNLKEPNNSLCGTNNTKNTALDPHMMKNIEWGAVAYLSRSIYGMNGEVWNNPYYNNTTNYSPITGLCGNASNGKDNATTDITQTYKYNETGGENASTTGNVYGIYDMAGGAWEYVAGILSNYKSNSSNYDFSNSTTYLNKYFDWYAGNTSDRNTNYDANANKYGDAVYETSSSGWSNTDSWDSSYSIFSTSSSPVFKRGGRVYDGSNAGVFAFIDSTGGAYTNDSFRPVVLSSQP